MIRNQCFGLSLCLLLLPMQSVKADPVIANPQQPVSPQLAERAVDVIYSGRLFGIPVIRAKISAVFLQESYAARAEFRTSGLAAFFKQIKVVASAQGLIKNNRLLTKEYWHKELDGRKNRELFMSFEPQKVTLRVHPPLRTMGDPAASMEQRLEALDPISAVLALAIGSPENNALQQCEGSVKVFDGKQRYDLRLQAMGMQQVRTSAYRGMALRCNVWYVPVAGFNADDLNDPEYDKPVTMWLADQPAAGLWLPVRFTAKLAFGTAVVEARKIIVR